MSNEYRQDENYRGEKLTEEEYRVCRLKGTERPFAGIYNTEFRAGTYQCKCCGAPLFASTAKFDAGCGWSSFNQVISEASVREIPDPSLGMMRTEITCTRCGCHLGHVFEDGPQPTGLRYCVNSVSVDFTPAGD